MGVTTASKRGRIGRNGSLSCQRARLSSRDSGHRSSRGPDSLLASGLFLTIVPASALRFPTARPELKVLPVTLPMTRVPVGIVTLKNRTLSPVAKLFIDHARDVARPLAKGK